MLSSSVLNKLSEFWGRMTVKHKMNCIEHVSETALAQEGSEEPYEGVAEGPPEELRRGLTRRARKNQSTDSNLFYRSSNMQ